MAGENPYLALVPKDDAPDAPAKSDPFGLDTPSDHPALDELAAGGDPVERRAPNPYVDVLAQMDSEDDAQKDEHLRTLQAASLRTNLDREAGIRELARLSGASPATIETKYDEMRTSIEAADFDPRAFRRENPRLAALLFSRPDLAPLVMRDESMREFAKKDAPQVIVQDAEVGPVARGLGALARLAKYVEATTPEPGAVEAADAGALARLLDYTGVLPQDASTPQAAARRDEIFGRPDRLRAGALPTRETFLPPTKQQLMEVDPAASETGLTKLWHMASGTYEQSRKGIAIDKLGSEIVWAKLNGRDTTELERHLVELRQDMGLPKYYGAEGLLETSVRDVAEAGGSQLETLGAQGTAGAAAWLIGKDLERVSGRPGLAREFSKWASRVAGFAASYNLELGGSYLDFRDTPTDQGQPVSDELALGGALVSAAIKSVLEVGGNEYLLHHAGPLGTFLQRGERKAAAKALLSDKRLRALALEVGRQLVQAGKSGLMEGSEEYTQQLTDDLTGYVLKSLEAGNVTQEADVGGATEGQVLAFRKGFAGGAGFSGAAGVLSVGHQAATYNQTRAGQKMLAKIVEGSKKSPYAKADPAAFAAAAKEATGDAGHQVSSVYVDPQALTRHFQDSGLSVDDVATQIMGDTGPKRLQAALATETKLEVPLKEFVERWVPRGITEQLLEDMTTRADAETPRVQAARDQAMQVRVQELAKEFSAEQAPATGPIEQAFLDRFGREVGATEADGKKVGKRAANHVALARALGHAMAERMDLPTEQIFEQLDGIRVRQATQADLKAPEAVRLNQPENPVAGETTTAQQRSATTDAAPHLEAAYRELQQQAKTDPTMVEGPLRLYYEDPVTGTLHERAARDLPVDPARPERAILSFGYKKGINDTLGHEALDKVYADVARVVHGIAPEVTVAKVGGDLWLGTVKDQKELDEKLLPAVREALKTELPQGLNEVPVAAALVPRVEGQSWRDTQHLAGDKLGEVVDKQREAGTYPARTAPVPEMAAKPKGERAAGVPIPAALQEQFKTLSDRQVAEEAFTETETGALNKRGWRENRKRNPKPVVASMDVRGVGAMDAAGHAVADAIIKFTVEQFVDAGGHEFDVAHVSGDEIMFQANDAHELRLFLDQIAGHLETLTLDIETAGGIVRQEGVHLAYGIAERGQQLEDGTTLDTDDAVEHYADAVALPRAKQSDPRSKEWFAARTRSFTAAEQEAGLPTDPSTDLRLPGADSVRLRGPSPKRSGLRQVLGGLAGDLGQGGGVEGLHAGGRPLGEGGTQSPEVGPDGKTRLFAGDERSPRGWVDFAKRLLGASDKRSFEIITTPKADLSTVLHELGHTFFELLGDLAEREGAPEQVRRDFQTLLAYAGVERRDQIRDEHHEKIARSFERFLMEGKAPSRELRGAFRRFRDWMLRVYRRVQALDVPDLNDEVRGVFDRMLATDDAIRDARERAGIKPLFDSAEAAGMSAEEYQRHLDKLEEATSHAEAAARLAEVRQQLKEKGAELREHAKQFEEEARAQYDGLKETRAKRLLEKGELVASDGGVISKGVEPTFENLSEAAELLGYENADALKAAAEAHPDRATWVRQAVDRRVSAELAALVDEREQLRARVEKGIRGDATLEWLLEEWKALARHAGDGEVRPLEVLRRVAKELVRDRTMGDIRPDQALRAERSNADKAARAAAKGNYAQSFAFKQKQLLNMLLHRELLEAKELRDRFETMAKRLSKPASRERLGLADPIYRDVVDTLLEALGAVARRERDREPAGIDAAVERMDKDGLSVYFDAEPLKKLLWDARKDALDWRQLTVAQMENVVTALKQIEKAASFGRQVIVAGKQVAREEVIAGLRAEAQKNLPAGRAPAKSTVEAMSWFERQVSRIHAIDGELLRPETIFGFLGGQGVASTWFKAFVQTIQDAKQREAELLKDVMAPVVKLLDELPEEQKARWNRPVNGAELFPRHRQQMDRPDLQPPSRFFEIVWMAVNSGNESNLQRLLEGRNIAPEEHARAMDMLEKPDWDVVQAILDACEKMWPLVRDLEERTAGVPPPKIKATPIATKFGVYRGGYFPAVYDRRATEDVGERQAASIGELAGVYGRAAIATPKSHTKTRADRFAAAISLSPATFKAHLVQVAHDLAYREPIQSVGSLLFDEEVRGLLTHHLGHEWADLPLRWLQAVARQRGSQTASQAKALERFAGELKADATRAVLGYRPDIFLGDAANLVVAASTLEKRHWAAGVADFMADPVKQRRFVLEKSGEMRTRDHRIAEEFEATLASMTSSDFAKKGPVGWYRNHAFVFFEWSDAAFATPIWLGGYRQGVVEAEQLGLAGEEAEKHAVAFADHAVRKTFPSGSVVDMPAMLRDKGFIGRSLAFFGFFGNTYSRYREIWHHDRRGAVATAAMNFALVSAGLVLGDLLTKGHGPDDGEDWRYWFMRKMLLAPALTLPFVGAPLEAAVNSAATGKYQRVNVRASPAFSMVEALADVGLKAARGKASTQELTRSVARVVSVWRGVPLEQALRLTAPFLTDTPANGPADAAHRAFYGQRRGR